MTNNKQQTAVGFIQEQLRKYVRYDNRDAVETFDKIFEQAKEMHKEETIKLYYAYEDYVLREEGIIKTFGQFYNENYK
jgi:hypothetical protein